MKRRNYDGESESCLDCKRFFATGDMTAPCDTCTYRKKEEESLRTAQEHGRRRGPAGVSGVSDNAEAIMNEDSCNIFTATATTIVFIGVFFGGYILSATLKATGYKNDGDMAIPAFIYVTILVLIAIYAGFKVASLPDDEG